MFLTRKHALRFVLMNAAPGDGAEGGGGAAPGTPTDPTPAEPTAGAPEPASGSASTPTEPADPFAGLRNLMDTVGQEGQGDPESPPAASSQARDPSGRFASNSQSAAGVAATPTPPQPTAAPAPKPGEVDLTPPEGMSERAQSRWAQLTERVKSIPDLERRASEAQTALDSVRQMVTTAGLEPQEFTDMLETGRLFKSNNPADLQNALQRLDQLRTDVAVRLGVDAPAPDPLSAHPDLVQKVGNLLMTREDALEIAKLRQQGAQAQQVTRSQQEMQQFHATVQTAAAGMEKTLAARAGTPGHDAKVQYIAKHFSNPENLQKFVTTYKPEQWEPALLLMYDSYVPPAPALPSVQPLRPNNVRTGAPVHTGPVTAQGAVESAFDRLGI